MKTVGKSEGVNPCSCVSSVSSLTEFVTDLSNLSILPFILRYIAVLSLPLRRTT